LLWGREPNEHVTTGSDLPTPQPADVTLIVGGRIAGPFTMATVQDMLAAGQVSPSTPDKRCGAKAWRPLSDLFRDDATRTASTKQHPVC
jgi:hypothetical protein